MSATSAADLVLIGPQSEMTVQSGDFARIAVVEYNSGSWAVEFQLNEDDGQALHSLTLESVGHDISVLVCREEVLRPKIQAPISGGLGMITVDTEVEARRLAAILSGDAACVEAS